MKKKQYTLMIVPSANSRVRGAIPLLRLPMTGHKKRARREDGQLALSLDSETFT